MKRIKQFIMAGMLAGLGGSLLSCTDLTETVYDQVMSQNYYQSKQDIINAVFRPMEHIYSCSWIRYEMEEEPADQVITPVRGNWYVDGGRWGMLHRHQYDDITMDEWTREWENYYAGIGQCNLVLDDLSKLSPGKFEMTDREFDELRGQLRCARAFCYLRLINVYRNCVLTTTSDQAVNERPENRKQVAPEVLFGFIESELLDCLNALPGKSGQGGNRAQQGTWTKASAAALLARLYLNAQVWIGEPKWQECINICERIMGGEFGYYEIAKNWYEPFDWNNEECDEVIYGFPGSYGTSSWHLQNDLRTVYGRNLPYGCQYYLGIEGNGDRNPKFALTPSYDNQVPRQLFTHKLGMVSQKFKKYSDLGDDLRFKQYKNLSVNTREGMFFLEGYIPGRGDDPNGKRVYAQNPDKQYNLYLRDQVGSFENGAPQGIIANSARSESIMENGDFNSGLCCVKYPLYSFTGGYYIESDYTEIRLAEVVYSAAECYLRLGNARKAGTLLNSVRKRNYTNWSALIAYQDENNTGNIVLDLEEMLDEWGREFLVESRRRTDLIRFGRFQEAWWDKPADLDKHYELYPIPRTALEQNSYLKQNPGYPDIER